MNSTLRSAEGPRRQRLLVVLADVSGSMRAVLEVGRSEATAESRFLVVCRTVLSGLREDVGQGDNTAVALGVFGTKRADSPTLDLLSVLRLLRGATARANGGLSGRDRLKRLAAREGRSEVVSKYIDTKLSDMEAGILHMYLAGLEVAPPRASIRDAAGRPITLQSFLEAIPEDSTVNAARAGGGLLGSLAVIGGAVLLGPVGIPALLLAGAATAAAGYGGVRGVDTYADGAAERSEAFILAKKVAESLLLYGHEVLTPTSSSEAISLLEEFLNEWQGRQDSGVSELFKSLEPYIYGGTPMGASMSQARATFDAHIARVGPIPAGSPWQDKDMLVIVSDGLPTDNVEQVKREAAALKTSGVQIASIFLTERPVPDALRLHHAATPAWSDGERLLFEIGSEGFNVMDAPISTLRAIKWEIPPEGACRLFARISSTSILSEFVHVLLANSFEHPDALMDLVGRISLDAIVGDAHREMIARDQEEKPICYAFATAAVVHLAMQRIHEREDRPPFESILQYVLGYNNFPLRAAGWSIRDVLPPVARQYRLRSRHLNEREARLAVLYQRPVLARFSLTGAGWAVFSKFFFESPTGILTKELIDPFRQWKAADKGAGGHAVVVTRVAPDHLLILNSWGPEWGDRGFFRVANAGVLGMDGDSEWSQEMRFFDVYWTEDDLLPAEVTAYRAMAEVRARAVGRRNAAVGRLPYRCPHCLADSNLEEFSGDLWSAECPKCHQHFRPEPGQLTTALYARHNVA